MVSALELVIGRYLERTDAVLHAQREACLAANDRHAANAKAVTEQIVDAAGGYGVKPLRASAQDTAEAITRSATAEQSRNDAALREVRRLLWLDAFVSAAGVLASLALAIGTLLTLHSW